MRRIVTFGTFDVLHVGHVLILERARALGDRLIELLADRPRAHRMGLAGRRRAEERFSWEVVAARMGERLQRCLKSSPR